MGYFQIIATAYHTHLQLASVYADSGVNVGANAVWATSRFATAQPPHTVTRRETAESPNSVHVKSNPILPSENRREGREVQKCKAAVFYN